MKTRSVDWIVVLLGKRKAAGPSEHLYTQPTGPRTRTEFRYRLRGQGPSGHLQSRRMDETYWRDLGERSVSEGDWSELVSAVEAELEAEGNVDRVTRTTP